jgi:transcriptional regulator with XRE-family HTH domain
MLNEAASQSDSSTETEALAVDDTADHGLPSALAQLLRTARHYLGQAMDTMREVASRTSDSDWNEHTEQLRRVASFVDDRVTALLLGQRSFLLPDQFQHFSALLRQRRESAHLSRSELAKRSGLSDRTIKNIENGHGSPSRDTLLRLLEVAELALTWKDVLGDPPQLGTATDESSDSSFNCYIPPGYEPLRMFQQHVRMLNGPGGHIEQTNAYLEHRSALSYVSMCNEPGVVTTYRAKYPLRRARPADNGGRWRRSVEGHRSRGSATDILEVRLVQHLLSMRCKSPDIELLLFDISQPLLTTAYQHAIDTFGEQSAVHTLLVHGNFHDLAQYPQVSYTPAKGRRRPHLHHARLVRSPTSTASRDFSSTASRTANGRHAAPRLSAKRTSPVAASEDVTPSPRSGFPQPVSQASTPTGWAHRSVRTASTTCPTSSRFSS